MRLVGILDKGLNKKKTIYNHTHANQAVTAKTIITTKTMLTS
jgi:hypothetical protein